MKAELCEVSDADRILKYQLVYCSCIGNEGTYPIPESSRGWEDLTAVRKLSLS
jgi:hypothetical protein